MTNNYVALTLQAADDLLRQVAEIVPHPVGRWHDLSRMEGGGLRLSIAVGGEWRYLYIPPEDLGKSVDEIVSEMRPFLRAMVRKGVER